MKKNLPLDPVVDPQASRSDDRLQRTACNDAVWRRLMWIVWIFALGWTAMLVYDLVMATVLHCEFQWTTFLTDPHEAYKDLLVSREQVATLRPYGISMLPANQFPLLFGLLALTRKMQPTPLLGWYLAIIFSSMLLLAALWLRQHRAHWKGDPRWAAVVMFVVALCFTNYPFLLAVNRGNLDPLAVLILAAAMILGQRRRGLLGGLALGLSAAIKGYSIAAVILWVKQRRWWGAVLAFIMLATLLAVPGFWFQGGIRGTLNGFRSGLTDFHILYIIGNNSAHFCADWINGIRLAFLSTGHHPDMYYIVPLCESVVLIWCGLLALYLLFCARSEWREWLAVVLIMLFLSLIINDYKLVLLVPVVLSWLETADWGWREKLFAICAGLLLVPKHYGGYLPKTDATVSCLVSPILLVGLSVVLWPTRDEVQEARCRVAAIWAVAMRVVRRQPRGGH